MLKPLRQDNAPVVDGFPVDGVHYPVAALGVESDEVLGVFGGVAGKFFRSEFGCQIQAPRQKSVDNIRQ